MWRDQWPCGGLRNVPERRATTSFWTSLPAGLAESPYVFAHDGRRTLATPVVIRTQIVDDLASPQLNEISRLGNDPTEYLYAHRVCILPPPCHLGRWRAPKRLTWGGHQSA